MNLFVGAFIGSPSMNFADAVVTGDRVRFAGVEMPLPADSPLRGHDRSLILGIRPTDFAHTADAADDLPRMTVVPSVVEELGAETYLVFTIDAPRVDTEATRAAAEGEPTEEMTLLADEEGAVFTARIDPRRSPRTATPVELAIDSERVHFFDPETGAALRATP